MKSKINWLDPAEVIPGPDCGPVLVEWHKANGKYGHCFATYRVGCQVWEGIPPESIVAGWAMVMDMETAPF